MRLVQPSAAELSVLLGGVACAQAAAALAFARSLSRPAPRPAAPMPPAAVLVPCKGALEGLESAVARLLAQEYHGEWKVFFVLPSQDDPASALLAPLLEGSRGRAGLLFGPGTAPKTSSGKIADLRAALRSLEARWEVLVFADADLFVPEGWLTALVGSLLRDGAGVSTAPMVYVPTGPSAAGFTRLGWFAAGLPWFRLLQNAAGQGMAVRRSDFEAWGVGELWDGVMLEDLTLAAAARSAGRRVVLAPALPSAPDPGGWGSLLALTSKWMTLYRFYDPRVWWLGAGLTAFKAYVWGRALAGDWRLGLLAWLGDGVFLFIVVSALERALPEMFSALPRSCRPAALWTALAAPLLQGVYAANYAASAFSNRVGWGAWTYRLGRSGRVQEVSPRA